MIFTGEEAGIEILWRVKDTLDNWRMNEEDTCIASALFIAECEVFDIFLSSRIRYPADVRVTLCARYRHRTPNKPIASRSGAGFRLTDHRDVAMLVKYIQHGGSQNSRYIQHIL